MPVREELGQCILKVRSMCAGVSRIKLLMFLTFGNFWLCGVRSGVLGHLSLRMVLFSETSSEGAGAVYLEGYRVWYVCVIMLVSAGGRKLRPTISLFGNLVVGCALRSFRTLVHMVVFSDMSSGAGAVYLEGTEHVCVIS